MATNPMLRTRSEAAAGASRQEQNRQWWERMPMTYARWDADDRSTTRERVIADFLAGNPFFAPEYFQRFAGKDVLEIGCGAGPATALFAEGGARVTAIDITDAGVELTRQHTEGLPVTVRRMDAEKLEFADASFDHAFAWGVLHHSDRSETAFAQIARVLRPGGTALVMVYNRASLRYWIKGAIWLVLRGRIFRGDTFASVQRFYTDGFMHRHFTPAELAAGLRPLEPVRISKTHMGKRMLPLIPRALDEWCKRRWGWLLVAEVRKAQA